MPPDTTEKDNTNGMVSVHDANVHNTNDEVKGPGCCKRFTDTIIGFLERSFAKLGFLVASHPALFIVIPIIVCGLCAIGLLEYYTENQPEKLWVPTDSQGLINQEWVKERFPSQSRIVNVILKSDSDILTPSGMKMLVDIDNKTKYLFNGNTDGLAWQDICYKVGKGAFSRCLTNTLLQIWNNNYALVLSLDKNGILNDINNKNKTGNMNLNLILGGISRSGGRIESAKAMKFSYFLKNQEIFVKSKGALYDEKGEDWELEFSKMMENEDPNGFVISSYTFARRQEDSGSSISDDLRFLVVGYILIIIYLAVMLGKFSRVAHKVWLAMAGVACVGLSVGVSYGLCSAFQISVSPVHNVLPFLLIGIGVDDVFVIVQNWDNIKVSDFKNPIPYDISQTMKYAGVSILVTSITDVCAFLIGATTLLPALRSFCIYAGIGVLAVFILTCTLFLALLSLDSSRQRDRRDACCCCIKLSDSWKALDCSKNTYLTLFMEKIYGKFLLSTPGRIIVMLVTAGLLAGGAYGLSQLKQDFDPNWFLPPDSDTMTYFNDNDEYFSTEGVRAAVFLGKVDYFADQKKLDDIYNTMNSNKYVVSGESSVKSWYRVFKEKWMPANINSTMLDSDGRPKTETAFYTYLKQFLISPEGSQFINEIIFEDQNKTVIKACRFEFTHIMFDGSSEEIEGMEGLEVELEKIVFSNGMKPFAYSREYIGWETNKVISTELIRNLVLAGVVVFLVTLFLIANIWVSLLVVSCVVFTLINIAGYMHFWGLTVDVVTTIQLVLAIGLSVDYSAHIGHGFMASRNGNRVDRARHALKEIGPAVVNGGFSTFLAFVFLAGSKSYVFSTFFKLFFLVVIFGCFHGLVYLPVILSIIGPKPYSELPPEENNSIEMKKESMAKTNEIYEKNDDSSHEVSYEVNVDATKPVENTENIAFEPN